jgi:hypothetical protein
MQQASPFGWLHMVTFFHMVNGELLQASTSLPRLVLVQVETALCKNTAVSITVLVAWLTLMT